MKIGNTNNSESEINFGAILQSIMLDYEQLANAHNILMKVLFKKGIIKSEEWENEIKLDNEEKQKIKERIEIEKSKKRIIRP